MTAIPNQITARDVTTTPRRPHNEEGGGLKGSRGPMQLGKRNCSTTPTCQLFSSQLYKRRRRGGVGPIWCFLQWAGGGQKLKLRQWSQPQIGRNRQTLPNNTMSSLQSTGIDC